jgi:hypothetical protein
VHELDVRRVLLVVELVGAGVQHDHGAALLHHRLPLVEVEQVAVRHHLHEQRVEVRVARCRADVGDAADEDVGLPDHRHEVLLVAALGVCFVHRLGLAGEDAR